MGNKIIYNSCFYISFFFLLFFLAKTERKIGKNKRIIIFHVHHHLRLHLIPRSLKFSQNKDRNEFLVGSLWEKAEGTGRKLPFLRCVI